METEKKNLVNLPKFHLEKFSGDPLKWQSFIETFETDVERQEQLSPVKIQIDLEEIVKFNFFSLLFSL